MADHMKLYLFGDQTYDLQTHLRDLLQKRNNPVVEDFLLRSYDAVRTEIYKLPPPTREAYPRFTCVDDLILWNQIGKRIVPLDMAVTSIYQLGMFISQSDPGDFFEGKALALDLCTGSLAAAAVACSHSVVDLVPLAVNAVVVAFKTGVLVNEVAHRVASPQESDQSWSVLIPGSKSSEAIREFCAQTVSYFPRLSLSFEI